MLKYEPKREKIVVIHSTNSSIPKGVFIEFSYETRCYYVLYRQNMSNYATPEFRL